MTARGGTRTWPLPPVVPRTSHQVAIVAVTLFAPHTALHAVHPVQHQPDPRQRLIGIASETDGALREGSLRASSPSARTTLFGMASSEVTDWIARSEKIKLPQAWNFLAVS